VRTVRLGERPALVDVSRGPEAEGGACTAIAPPSQRDRQDGCMSRRNTTPRAVPTGTGASAPVSPGVHGVNSAFGILCPGPFFPSERLGQPFLGFRLGAECVVFGVQRLVIFGHGALPLRQDIVDLAQVDIGPDLNPFRVPVAVEGIAE